MPPMLGFNTASGRYYCNGHIVEALFEMSTLVSIPQAVGTIAIFSDLLEVNCHTDYLFQYRKR